MVAAAEQDDPGRAPVVWLPLASAAGLHLYPAVGPSSIGPPSPPPSLCFLAPMTSDSYRHRSPLRGCPGAVCVAARAGEFAGPWHAVLSGIGAGDQGATENPRSSVRSAP